MARTVGENPVGWEMNAAATSPCIERSMISVVYSWHSMILANNDRMADIRTSIH